MLTEYYINKLKRYSGNNVKRACTICPYCKEAVTFRHEAYTNVEYLKMKNGNEQFFHTDCFQRFFKGGLHAK